MRARSAPAVARVNVSPSIATVPDEGGISPPSIRSVVVFPAPFGPSSPNTSPPWTVNVTLSTATRSPNRRVICEAAITGD